MNSVQETYMAYRPFRNGPYTIHNVPHFRVNQQYGLYLSPDVIEHIAYIMFKMEEEKISEFDYLLLSNITREKLKNASLRS